MNQVRDRVAGAVERGRVDDGAGLAVTVVGEVEEELVLDDGPADGDAVLMLDFDRLGEEDGVIGRAALKLVVRVERIPARRAVVLKDVAVKLVAAGLGDGVDDAAGRAAELGRVAYRRGLELADESTGKT
jgi:hypothetical protein